jgi:hypothetical protein
LECDRQRTISVFVSDTENEFQSGEMLLNEIKESCQVFHFNCEDEEEEEEEEEEERGLFYTKCERYSLPKCFHKTSGNASLDVVELCAGILRSLSFLFFVCMYQHTHTHARARTRVCNKLENTYSFLVKGFSVKSPVLTVPCTLRHATNQINLKLQLN